MGGAQEKNSKNRADYNFLIIAILHKLNCHK